MKNIIFVVILLLTTVCTHTLANSSTINLDGTWGGVKTPVNMASLPSILYLNSKVTTIH